MTLQPKQYVEGQDRKLDELVDLYKNIEGAPVAERDDSPERPITDPLGLNEPRRASAEPFLDARVVVDKMLRFFHLLRGEYVLSPEDTIYAAELFGLNVLNANDIPEGTQIKKSRDAAFDFYKRHAG